MSNVTPDDARDALREDAARRMRDALSDMVTHGSACASCGAPGPTFAPRGDATPMCPACIGAWAYGHGYVTGADDAMRATRTLAHAMRDALTHAPDDAHDASHDDAHAYGVGAYL